MTILVVDDEPVVRRLMGDILRRAGYDVFEAEDGLVACHLVRQLNGALDLLITDIQMPKMNGTEFIERIEKEFPALRILCISAYADPLPPPGHRFLAKPFTAMALSAMVAEAMGLSRGSAERTRQAPAASDESRRIPSELRQKLLTARAKLEIANQGYRELQAICADAVDNAPDSSMALRQALALKESAIRDYNRALREWTTFVCGRPGS